MEPMPQGDVFEDISSILPLGSACVAFVLPTPPWPYLGTQLLQLDDVWAFLNSENISMHSRKQCQCP